MATGALGESQQPTQRFAGHQHKQIDTARDHGVDPRQNRGSVGSVEDADQGTAQWNGAFFFEHLRQVFELTAFGESDRLAFEGTRHNYIYSSPLP